MFIISGYDIILRLIRRHINERGLLNDYFKDKIEEIEEVGKKYAEYKRNLKKWIKYLKDNEIMNLLVN